LSSEEALAVAVCSARYARERDLLGACLSGAWEAGVGDGTRDDALAATSLMALSDAYDPFRKLAASSYVSMSSRLRLSWSATLLGEKRAFELCCIAASAIGNCEA